MSGVLVAGISLGVLALVAMTVVLMRNAVEMGTGTSLLPDPFFFLRPARSSS